jgi:RHS repeat-associated protein
MAHYTFDTDSIEYQKIDYLGNIICTRTKVDTVITDKQKIFNAIGYYADGRYYHYVKNHLGSICLVIDSETDSVLQNTYYSASGVPSSTNLDVQPYLYNGKELIEAYGLNEYDSQARWYYAPIMRTTTMDPLAENYYHISPYAWCGNNLVNVVDADGRNPIYSKDGDFLGINELGLQGEAFFMDVDDFQNGMSLEESMKRNIGIDNLTQDALSKYESHYKSLSSRPDWDGIVTASEGISWAKSHIGALDNPTPDNMLYINTSLLDFGNISIPDLENGIGEISPIDLFNNDNTKQAIYNPALRNTVYALGRVDVLLLDLMGHVKVVEIGDGATDYDWNKGGGLKRNIAITLERLRANVSDQHGFKTFYYGIGTIRTK